MSPERSGYSEEEQILTPKMSVPASPVAGTPIREAQSPISILLAVAQNQMNKSDDDLTSLSWLQDKDILKGMNLINPSPSNSLQTTPLKLYNSNNVNNNNTSSKNMSSPTSDFVDDSSISATESSSSSSSINSPTPQQNNRLNKHPHNIPYDPLVHTNKKPPYSFSCLIFMAIEDSEQKALPVKEIYTWILEHFPYFKNAPTGWKNSVRHNLSLNKCFEKVEKAPNLGKGSLWTVDPQYRPNLLQAMTRSPYHPCSTLDPSSYFNNNNNNNRTRPIQEKTPINHLPNVDLYPHLSSETNKLIKSDSSYDDSLDAVDAATVMLSLRNGARPIKQRKIWKVITTSPSQDHTYSAAETLNGISNGITENQSERMYHKSSVSRKIHFDDEEERRIKEGAETLLNLAGITTYKRTNTNNNNNNNNDVSYTYDEVKRLKIEENVQEDDDVTTKPSQFRPRLLRKKRDMKKLPINNNNNNIVAKSEDEWVKHRRELEINGDR